MCSAQAFKLFDGYIMERRLLRAAYLQRFPTDDVLAQMAAGQLPKPCAGAANGAAATSSRAPAASTDIYCSLPATAKASCTCSAVLWWWCSPLL